MNELLRSGKGRNRYIVECKGKIVALSGRGVAV